MTAGGLTLPSERELFSELYESLRRVAHAQRRVRRVSDTLSTTALVHEAYNKLGQGNARSFENRAHFLATAAKAMRQVIATYAERKAANKRGGGQRPEELDEEKIGDCQIEEAAEVSRCLSKLELSSPLFAQVLECRLFGGMTVEETAAAMRRSPASVKRDLKGAMVWLYEEHRGGELSHDPVVGVEPFHSKGW